LLACPFSTIAFQPAVATTPDFVFIIDVADVVALLLVGIAVVYIVRDHIVSRASFPSAISPHLPPMLVVYIQHRHGPYNNGATVRRVFRNGIPAAHPVVYVFVQW